MSTQFEAILLVY